MLHHRLGLHLEKIHAGRTGPVAAELALHFERAGDAERAARYLGETADLAIQRSSHTEASTLARHGLVLLASVPESPARRALTFALLARLGNCLTMTKGDVDPEVRGTFGPAFELSKTPHASTPES